MEILMLCHESPPFQNYVESNDSENNRVLSIETTLFKVSSVEMIKETIKDRILSAI